MGTLEPKTIILLLGIAVCILGLMVIGLLGLSEHLKSELRRKEALLSESTDIDVVGKCANCGVEYHIHKSVNTNKVNDNEETRNA